MLTVLAPETIDTIIDYLHSDKQSLFACSLTAKQWLPSSRYHIFSRVHLRPTNIESFLELIEAPLSKLPVMLRHLLVNGFSQSIIAAVNPHAKEHIRRVTSRLQEVTYLRICNSSELSSDILSTIPSVKELALTQINFHGLDDMLEFVYSFPRLQSLSIMAISVQNPMKRDYPNPPGTGSPFYIRGIKASNHTWPFLADWLAALKPTPQIHLNLNAYDPKGYDIQRKLLRSVGPSIMSIDLEVGVLDLGVEGMLLCLFDRQ
jgi:hypothetical protein